MIHVSTKLTPSSLEVFASQSPLEVWERAPDTVQKESQTNMTNKSNEHSLISSTESQVSFKAPSKGWKRSEPPKSRDRFTDNAKLSQQTRQNQEQHRRWNQFLTVAFLNRDNDKKATA